jgi:predicted  nucleic acid-binding Zn-ribbon protein
MLFNINRAKASAEKSNKNLTQNLNDLNKRIEEGNMTLGDLENGKRKIAAENGGKL